MKAAPQGKTPPRMTAADWLSSVPHRNQAMEVARREKGVVAVIPVRRPTWLVPPISWVLPFSSHRRVELDELGTEVLDMCDGKETVETIVEKFAASHKLSFREAQLSVTQFLRMLAERGLVAVVSSRKGEPR